MVNSSKMGFVKYLLFAFNAIFVLCGIALIAVGAVVLTALSPQKPFYEGYLGAPVAIVVLGVFVFVLAFLGCCGAIRENYHMIMAFSVLLTIILICELGAAIAAYAYRSKIESAIRSEATKSIERYHNDTDVERLWDDIQSSLHCCGANSTADYGEKLPSSCCPDKPDDCTAQKAYHKNCIDVLLEKFNEKIVYVGVTGIIICFIEVVGIVFGCCLAKAIRKYEVV
ncbi:23 kDa integral membrane protein [Rhipicephalus sanguineus]|uniref:23 kDa integral membrane protein n=1 Tax=Rhipicephalus sanguineus TaxID=34632 RepID=UPI00189353CB|nr:23 kDa integral membrane protein [Rhipicephalus sanguineus]